MAHWSRFSEQKRQCIAAKSAGLCFYCGIMLDEPCKELLTSLSFDHVIPYQRGGTRAISNMVIACRKCNQDKGSLTYDEFKALRGEIFAEKYGFSPYDVPVSPKEISYFIRQLSEENLWS